MRVADFSDWQDDSYVDRVNADAFIFKATEGRQTPAKSFSEKMARAAVKGKHTGAYHFAHPEQNPAVAEADFFLSKIKPHEAQLSHVYLDYEPPSPKQSDVDWCVTWIKHVRSRTYLPVHIYMNHNTADQLRWQAVRDLGCKLWLAIYADTNRRGWEDKPWNKGAPSGWDGKILGQQYTDQGHVDGCGPIDLNVFYEWAEPKPPAQSKETPMLTGAIGALWHASGGEQSPVGKPLAPEQRSNREGAVFQRFERGLALWSEETGAHFIYGRILNRYGELGFEHGDMGLPTGPESDCARAGGRFQHFQGGAIIWSLESDAWESRGALREMWARDGYEGGKWGYPVGPINYNPVLNDFWQDYQGGRMVWKAPEAAKPRSIPQLRERVSLVDVEGRRFEGCTCIELTMPLVNAELRAAGIVQRGVDVMQGGWRPSSSYSANTHTQAGVLDIRPLWKDEAKAEAILHKWGWVRFRRIPWSNGDHYHIVLHDCPHQHGDAQAQLTGWNGAFKGGNGLARAGRFVGNYRSIRNWQDTYLGK